MRIGGAPVLAQRITYVGELGFELYVEPTWAVQVWDRLMSAGGAHGIEPAGYRTLDSLRMEKGYRYFGTDLTADDTPYEAGLGFCVRLDGEGRRSSVARPSSERETRQPGAASGRSLVGDEDYLTLYGGEAVHVDGVVVGRLRSCAYGFTVRTERRVRVPARRRRGGHTRGGRRVRRDRCPERSTEARALRSGQHQGEMAPMIERVVDARGALARAGGHRLAALGRADERELPRRSGRRRGTWSVSPARRPSSSRSTGRTSVANARAARPDGDRSADPRVPPRPGRDGARVHRGEDDVGGVAACARDGAPDGRVDSTAPHRPPVPARLRHVQGARDLPAHRRRTQHPDPRGLPRPPRHRRRGGARDERPPPADGPVSQRPARGELHRRRGDAPDRRLRVLGQQRPDVRAREHGAGMRVRRRT